MATTVRLPVRDLLTATTTTTLNRDDRHVLLVPTTRNGLMQDLTLLVLSLLVLSLLVLSLLVLSLLGGLVILNGRISIAWLMRETLMSWLRRRCVEINRSLPVLMRNNLRPWRQPGDMRYTWRHTTILDFDSLLTVIENLLGLQSSLLPLVLCKDCMLLVTLYICINRGILLLMLHTMGIFL
jgi:hypothetical protein